ncbi:MAG: diguanylate cyclase [Lachnospiraceae bacterium]|nr:diguanylate cyclase [Candidatus Merdinaster equi]
MGDSFWGENAGIILAIVVFVLILAVAACIIIVVIRNKMLMQSRKYSEELAEKNARIEKMTLETIAAIAGTIDAKDEYTKGHSRRVGEYSALIARELGWSEDAVNNIRTVALLHDIGKIGIPDAVLNKPGRLTKDEKTYMSQHVIIGGNILRNVTTIPNLVEGAKYHHERFDGEGYPDGLGQGDIPDVARIIAVADAYDAMTSNRIYRNRLSHDRVIEELRKGRGTQFDPVVVDALFRLVENKKFTTTTPELNISGMEDITQVLNLVMEKREEQIAEKMQLDSLTNTYNRTYGETMIIEAMNSGGGCLMLFDLDHFRVVNDQNGYVTGDIYLKIVVQCIRHMSNVRVISRFGGDEFCVYFKDMNTEEEAIHAVDRFMEDIRLEAASRKGLDELSVSVGITMCDSDALESFNDILYRADKALYVAKQDGGGKYYIYHQEEGVAPSVEYNKNELNKLVSYVKDKHEYSGAFQTSYPEFGRMFELIQKIAKRNMQAVQLIMFTVVANDGNELNIEERDWAMDILEQSVIKCVRSVDVTTKYSSSQQIVMLLNLEEEQIHIVTDRITKEFYTKYNRGKMKLCYDIADLGIIE